MYGVSPELEVEVSLAVNVEVAGIGTHSPEFSPGLVVQKSSLRLTDLSAHADVVLLVDVEEVESVVCLDARQRIASELMSRKEAYARLGPFVEALTQLYADGVLE